MEKHAEIMREIIKTRYQTPTSEKIKDFLLNSVFIIVCIFLFVILIDNPLSLAIICGTALLMWIWGNK